MLKKLTQPNKKILYLVTEDWAFISHRLPTARAARDAGFDVTVVTSIGKSRDKIETEGFNVIPLRWSRRSMNPLQIIRNIAEIRAIYKREKPQIVHHIALKPILLGSIASIGLVDVMKLNSVIGLGALQTLKDLNTRFIKFIVFLVFRILLNRENTLVLFQNSDDRNLILEHCGIDFENTLIVPGSGVDTQIFKPVKHSQKTPLTITIVSRMLKIKGIEDVVAASEILISRGIQHRLWLVGQVDPGNPSSYTNKQLENWGKKAHIDWHGHRTDIPEIWAESDIAVLASHGGEGVPKSLLEAASCSLPIVSTDVPGCREIAKNETTGFLVEPGNPSALADVLEKLHFNPELRELYGTNARQLVLDQFDALLIKQQMKEIYLSSGSENLSEVIS